jgi:hypothetical protein
MRQNHFQGHRRIVGCAAMMRSKSMIGNGDHP